MSVVHYEIWACPGGDFGMNYPEHSRKLVASGTLVVSNTLTSPIRVPALPNRQVPVVHFRVAGTDRAYIITAAPNQNPTGTGAHASADDTPRVLLEAADGFRAVPMEGASAFAVVQAAAIS